MRDLLAGSSLPVASAIVFNVVRRREIESGARSTGETYRSSSVTAATIT
jgi:hypothetical protein